MFGDVPILCASLAPGVSPLTGVRWPQGDALIQPCVESPALETLGQETGAIVCSVPRQGCLYSCFLFVVCLACFVLLLIVLACDAHSLPGRRGSSLVARRFLCASRCYCSCCLIVKMTLVLLVDSCIFLFHVCSYLQLLSDC